MPLSGGDKTIQFHGCRFGARSQILACAKDGANADEILLRFIERGSEEAGKRTRNWGVPLAVDIVMTKANAGQLVVDLLHCLRSQ